MKISILLPYKENFSPIYAGAVSLFVRDTVKISKFKKYITVYGNTDYKNVYKLSYKNIFLKLYKYVSSNRLDIFEDLLIRFSQRLGWEKHDERDWTKDVLKNVVIRSDVRK